MLLVATNPDQLAPAFTPELNLDAFLAKQANVPVVPGCPMPEELLHVDGPLVVGLTKDPSSLVQVRQNRLRMLTGVKP